MNRLNIIILFFLILISQLATIPHNVKCWAIPEWLEDRVVDPLRQFGTAFWNGLKQLGEWIKEGVSTIKEKLSGISLGGISDDWKSWIGSAEDRFGPGGGFGGGGGGVVEELTTPEGTTYYIKGDKVLDENGTVVGEGSLAVLKARFINAINTLEYIIMRIWNIIKQIPDWIEEFINKMIYVILKAIDLIVTPITYLIDGILRIGEMIIKNYDMFLTGVGVMALCYGFFGKWYLQIIGAGLIAFGTANYWSSMLITLSDAMIRLYETLRPIPLILFHVALIIGIGFILLFFLGMFRGMSREVKTS